VTVYKARQAGTGHVVQSSRVSVTVGQPVWIGLDAVVGTVTLVMVMSVFPSGKLDWARTKGALAEGEW
jgi:hypothetical protein